MIFLMLKHKIKQKQQSLLIMFISRSVQSLNIFGSQDGYEFEF
jgi:hypothetical protein